MTPETFCLFGAYRLLSSTSLRPLFLLSVSLLGLMLLERWKPKMPIITGKHLNYNPRLFTCPAPGILLLGSYMIFGFLCKCVTCVLFLKGNEFI